MSYGVSRDTIARVDGGRCVTCNRVTVTAWVCIDCATDFGEPYCDRATTATALGRGLQRRVDIAAAYEQLIQCQTAMDAKVIQAENDGVRRSPSHNGRQSSRPVDPRADSRSDICATDGPIYSEYRRSLRIRQMMQEANSIGGFTELRDLRLPGDVDAWWFKER